MCCAVSTVYWTGFLERYVANVATTMPAALRANGGLMEAVPGAPPLAAERLVCVYLGCRYFGNNSEESGGSCGLGARLPRADFVRGSKHRLFRL